MCRQKNFLCTIRDISKNITTKINNDTYYINISTLKTKQIIKQKKAKEPSKQERLEQRLAMIDQVAQNFYKL